MKTARCSTVATWVVTDMPAILHEDHLKYNRMHGKLSNGMREEGRSCAWNIPLHGL